VGKQHLRVLLLLAPLALLALTLPLHLPPRALTVHLHHHTTCRVVVHRWMMASSSASASTTASASASLVVAASARLAVRDAVAGALRGQRAVALVRRRRRVVVVRVRVWSARSFRQSCGATAQVVLALDERQQRAVQLALADDGVEEVTVELQLGLAWHARRAELRLELREPLLQLRLEKHHLWRPPSSMSSSIPRAPLWVASQRRCTPAGAATQLHRHSASFLPLLSASRRVGRERREGRAVVRVDWWYLVAEVGARACGALRQLRVAAHHGARRRRRHPQAGALGCERGLQTRGSHGLPG
jgi:hypothetical protein